MQNILKQYTKFEFFNNIKLCFISIPDCIDYFFSQLTSPYPIYPTIYPPLYPIDPENKLKQIFNKTEMDLIQNFKTSKKQAEWICGKIAIKLLVLSENSHVDFKDVVVSQHELGAPYLRRFPQYNISISHAHFYAVGALSPKNLKIGIDIEKISKEYPEYIIQVAFTENEFNNLPNRSNDRSNDKLNRAIFKNWTIKEAYLKYIKKGFHEDLKKVEVINNKIFHKGKHVDYINIYSKYIGEDYIFTIVHDL